jgi:hypothetical protein
VIQIVRWALLPALFVINPAHGDGTEKEPETPSLEMLEYLGEWEQEDKQWIDPLSLYESDMTDPVPVDYRPEEKDRP